MIYLTGSYTPSHTSVTAHIISPYTHKELNDILSRDNLSHTRSHLHLIELLQLAPVPSAMKQVAPFGKLDGSKTKLPIPGSASPITPASDSKKDKETSTTTSQKKDSQESISKPLQLQLQQPISASQSASSSAKSPQPLGPPALVSAASWDGLNGKNPSTAQALPKDFVFAQPLALPPRDGPRRENQ